MTDTKKKTTLKDGSISLTLKLKKQDLATAYSKILLESAKHVELKGFRKGKAPINLVEASLDKSKLYSRVIEVVLPPAYSKALQAGKHLPLIDPKITPIKMEEGQDWEFTAETAEAPEVKVGDYKAYIKKALTKAKKEIKKDTKENWQLKAVLDAILDNAEVTPAPLLVSKEAHNQIQRLESQLSQLKLTLSDYLANIKKTEKDFHAEYHQTATDNLRLEFALKAIVDDMHPEVTDQELEALKPTPEQLPYAKYLLQKQKMLDILVEL